MSKTEATVTLSLVEFDEMRKDLENLREVVREFQEVKEAIRKHIYKEMPVGMPIYEGSVYPFKLFASKEDLKEIVDKYFVDPLNCRGQ